MLGLEKIEASYPGRAVYHHSCHMKRGLGVTEEPIQLLKSVQDLELVELPYQEDCCGFGGTFAVKMGPLSEQMVDEKVEHLLSSGADILVGSDLACLMNIGGRLRRMGSKMKVLHVAELLYKGVEQHATHSSSSL